MTKILLRSVVATIVGIMIAYALIALAQYAGGELSPDVYDLGTEEVLVPLGSTVALLIGWLAGSFAGGWIAMRVSGTSGAGWVVAGAVIGAGVYRSATLGDAWWMMALGVVLPLAAAWLAQRATGMADTAAA